MLRRSSEVEVGRQGSRWEWQRAEDRVGGQGASRSAGLRPCPETGGAPGLEEEPMEEGLENVGGTLDRAWASGFLD